MLPERLLDVTIAGDEVRPRYLGERDRLWVEALLDELIACQGLRRADVDARLAASGSGGLTLTGDAPPRACRAMIELLYRAIGFEVRACHPPVELRARVFPRAAMAGGPDAPNAAPAAPGAPPAALDAPPAAPGVRAAARVLATVADELGLDPDAVARDLYADVPSERRLGAVPEQLSVDALLGRYNLSLAQGMLIRAQSLSIEVMQNVKGLLRFARLQRLLCLAEPAGHGARLQLSGPLALFHHTIKYGRAMAAWLPVLVRTAPWQLSARCVLRGQELRWRASHRDPLGTTHAPLRRFDSKLEERLFRDLRRLAPGWQVLRESDPVQLGRRIVCPDFTLVEPGRHRRIPVEIVGFWTPQYLRDKLATLRALPAHARWLVCVDEELAAAEAHEIAAAPEVFTFRRRIDARRLLDHLGQLTRC